MYLLWGMPRACVEVREPLARVSSLLLPCGLAGFELRPDSKMYQYGVVDL